MTAVPAELATTGRPPLKEAGLWLCAGFAVLVAHAAFAYLLADIGPVPAHDAMEQAMEIDLAPLPVSVPEAVQSEALAQEHPIDTIEPVEETNEAIRPLQERVAEAPPETVREVPPKPEAAQPVTEEDVPPEPETVRQEPEDVQSAKAEQPDLSEQETLETVKPEVAIPLPQPRPEREQAEKPAPPKKQLVRRKAVDRKAKETADPPKRRTPPASQASAASRAPSIDPSRWNSAVRAAIARRAGAVRGMRGTVRVSFVVSSSGAIVSASVSGSSGDERLDQAALRMVRSARVPAPPAGLGGSSHAFAVPLSFR